MSVAAVEVAHIAAGRSMGTLSLWMSNVVAALFAVLCLAGAAALMLRDRAPWIATAAWMLGFLMPMGLLMHAVSLNLVGDRSGLLLIPVAIAVGLCVKRTFDHGAWQQTRALARHDVIARGRV